LIREHGAFLRAEERDSIEKHLEIKLVPLKLACTRKADKFSNRFTYAEKDTHEYLLAALKSKYTPTGSDKAGPLLKLWKLKQKSGGSLRA
jgi:hypothetical protein